MGLKEEDTKTMTKVKELTSSFLLSDQQLKQMMVLLHHEFEAGLKDEDKATIKMLVTFVRALPTGTEQGKFLALDLGGTNFRVLLVTLKGGSEATLDSERYPIPGTVMRGEGFQLFDFIATCLLKFVALKGLERQRIPLGLTFSFPCHQFGLTVSRLIRWTKGFHCSGVEGRDVVMLLREAIQRVKGRIRVSAYIDIVAIINDTTGTLMACAHRNKDCRIGLIVGTGCNACYMEKLQNIEKWPENYTHPNHVIVNTEWGAFGEKGVLDSMRNKWDEKLDEMSINSGRQLYEKMVSGMYLGELVRLVLVSLCQEGLIFKGHLPSVLSVRNGFPTKFISIVETSDPSNSCQLIKDLLKKQLSVGDHFTDIDIAILRLVCDRVSSRAAHLVAAGCATIISRMERPFTVIGYDGSVLKHHPNFRQVMEAKIRELVDPRFAFGLMLSEDGSGRGAALVAAVSYREKRPLIIIRGNKVYELSTYSTIN